LEASQSLKISILFSPIQNLFSILCPPIFKS
jgi:hypothetical protein